MDFQRNGRTCSLCLTNYTIVQPLEFERIPLEKTIVYHCLNSPGLILLVYNYLYVICLSSTSTHYAEYFFLENLYRISQYVFHFVYIVLFMTEWNVVNSEMYWKQAKTILAPILFMLHYYLFVLLDNHMFLIGPLLSFYMGLYWKAHIHILEHINIELEQLEDA